jgi:hypothetical protein
LGGANEEEDNVMRTRKLPGTGIVPCSSQICEINKNEYASGLCFGEIRIGEVALMTGVRNLKGCISSKSYIWKLFERSVYREPHFVVRVVSQNISLCLAAT